MVFDIKVQNLAMIYYQIGRSLPQKSLTWGLFMVPFMVIRIKLRIY
jgi:hypothetical protein